ncbi:MAG: hypothetical protein HS111_01035 [Kofleriaceae bacterium]|nr:hypothetical protein [Kofleriaceae bacterium]
MPWLRAPSLRHIEIQAARSARGGSRRLADSAEVARGVRRREGDATLRALVPNRRGLDAARWPPADARDRGRPARRLRRPTTRRTSTRRSPRPLAAFGEVVAPARA